MIAPKKRSRGAGYWSLHELKSRNSKKPCVCNRKRSRVYKVAKQVNVLTEYRKGISNYYLPLSTYWIKRYQAGLIDTLDKRLQGNAMLSLWLCGCAAVLFYARFSVAEWLITLWLDCHQLGLGFCSSQTCNWKFNWFRTSSHEGTTVNIPLSGSRV